MTALNLVKIENGKPCSKCKAFKPFSEFKKHRLHSDGLYSQCRTCVNEKRHSKDYKEQALQQQRAWRKKPGNLEKTREWCKKRRNTEKGKNCSKNWFLKNLYGISLDEYNAMFAKQNGCCSICGKHQSSFSKSLAVDHDHVTKRIRSLLCHFCNTAIGNFEENIELMYSAIDYIKKHKEK